MLPRGRGRLRVSVLRPLQLLLKGSAVGVNCCLELVVFLSQRLQLLLVAIRALPPRA